MSNQRYKELKYEGKTYSKRYEIDEILLEKDMNWFLDAEIENARIEIMKDTLIFNAGIWYNGIWEYGVIRDIDWRAGTFQNGVIYNGIFKKIKMEKGIIFDGTFISGDILYADIRGGEFKNVNVSDNVKKTQAPPPQPQETQQTQVQGETTQTQTQPQVQGDIKDKGQEIQAQVTERKYIKTFETFIIPEKPIRTQALDANIRDKERRNKRLKKEVEQRKKDAEQLRKEKKKKK